MFSELPLAEVRKNLLTPGITYLLNFVLSVSLLPVFSPSSMHTIFSNLSVNWSIIRLANISASRLAFLKYLQVWFEVQSVYNLTILSLSCDN